MGLARPKHRNDYRPTVVAASGSRPACPAGPIHCVLRSAGATARALALPGAGSSSAIRVTASSMTCRDADRVRARCWRTAAAGLGATRTGLPRPTPALSREARARQAPPLAGGAVAPAIDLQRSPAPSPDASPPWPAAGDGRPAAARGGIGRRWAAPRCRPWS